MASNCLAAQCVLSHQWQVFVQNVYIPWPLILFKRPNLRLTVISPNKSYGILAERGLGTRLTGSGRDWVFGGDRDHIKEIRLVPLGSLHP